MSYAPCHEFRGLASIKPDPRVSVVTQERFFLFRFTRKYLGIEVEGRETGGTPALPTLGTSDVQFLYSVVMPSPIDGLIFPFHPSYVLNIFYCWISHYKIRAARDQDGADHDPPAIQVRARDVLL